MTQRPAHKTKSRPSLRSRNRPTNPAQRLATASIQAMLPCLRPMARAHTWRGLCRWAAFLLFVLSAGKARAQDADAGAQAPEEPGSRWGSILREQKPDETKPPPPPPQPVQIDPPVLAKDEGAAYPP